MLPTFTQIQKCTVDQSIALCAEWANAVGGVQLQSKRGLSKIE